MSPSSRTLRMPGSVAEVLACPPGPRVGAFFDVEGAVVAGFNAAAQARDRTGGRDFGFGELLGFLGSAISPVNGGTEFEKLLRQFGRAQSGRQLSELKELGEQVFRQKIALLIYPEMRELVGAHLQRGHTVVLTSSALTMQVEPLARFLGVDDVISNSVDTDADDTLTGGIIEPVLWGPTKASAVQQFAAERDIQLEDSYFYAAGDENLALMHLVGQPRPTNPQRKMASVAAQRGWPALKFTSRGTGATSLLRNMAGMGALLPVALGATGVGLVTRNKRQGLNYLTSNWPRLLLSLNGVKLNVMGEHNLTANRPAVFIFNHRNNFDPFITAALVRDNWTGVGKKELEKDPIAGAIGKLLDTAYIDRDDAASAIESLQKIEEHAKKGLSILIAPEGTRLDTSEVGPFKKGPFRIAMSAGIPIVPIVIRNAETIAARDSNTMNPGTVDVVVLPPIPVDGWTVQDLPDRIAEVRQIYLDLLRNWPPGESPQPAQRSVVEPEAVSATAPKVRKARAKKGQQ